MYRQLKGNKCFREKKNYIGERGAEIAEGQIALFSRLVKTGLSEKVAAWKLVRVQPCSSLREGQSVDSAGTKSLR